MTDELIGAAAAGEGVGIRITGELGSLHLHHLSVDRQRGGVVFAVDQGPLVGAERGAGEQGGEAFAFVAGAVEAGVEAAVEGVAGLLQQHAGELAQAQLAGVEQIGIHIDPLLAGVADGCVGGQGAVELGIAAQFDLDAQAGAAEAVDQCLPVGVKRGGIAAGVAEHLLQELIAVAAVEQLSQGAAGIGERLLPQRLGDGAEQRGALGLQHVVLRRLRGAAEGHQQCLAAAVGAQGSGVRQGVGEGCSPRIGDGQVGQLGAGGLQRC